MLIDVHAHIFPDKIALKAAENIGAFYGIPMRYNGTRDVLIEQSARAGIDKCVVHSVATTQHQVKHINDFIIESVQLYPDRLIGFCTLHPFMDDVEAELDRALEAGLKGVKLHPDFQKFDIDDKRAKRIYAAAQGRCPILIHMGDARTQYSKAEKLVGVLDEFQDLDVIAAHFGGYSEWGNGAAYLSMTRAYVDTSSSLFALETRQARELIDIYTPDRVLFGTDYPMWDAAEELERFNKIPLTDSEREKITHENIEKLLKKYE